MKTRRFSLEKDFMNYSIDDLLYGAMQHLATYHPQEEKLYLTKKNLTKNKKEIYTLCDLNSRTLKAHIEKLIKRGLIAEENVKSGDVEYPSYVFPFDYDANYQLVNWEMLWYLVCTRNKSVIQVYVYLLNKYLWKKQEKTTYIFTNKELQVAIGYSENTKLADSIITNILYSLRNEGIINYEEYYEEKITNDGGSVPTPKKRLLFVAENVKDFNKN